MELENTDLTIECGEVELVTSSSNVSVEVNTEIEMFAKKREYSIVNDALYASMSTDAAPQWLTSIIDNVVNGLVSTKLTDLNRAIDSINTSLLELDVAKNQYNELINIESTINGVLANKLTTLNATVQQNASNIINLDTVKVTPNEALAISVEHISSQINNGDIRSLVTQINSTIANNEVSAAQRIETLESVYDENESTVRTILSNSVGEYTATANALTELEVSINDELYGATGLENTLKAEITSEGARVESKFEYNSIIGIDGVYKKSGFGLTTNYTSGTGTEIDPYTSEFWIDASRFKFTNSNKTGSVTPFTIDANGVTPQITFNGFVTFGSGQSGTIEEAIASTIETIQVGDKNINITDNLIPTTSMTIDIDNSGYQFIGTPVKSYEAGIDTFAEAQVTLGLVDEVYSPYVDEMFIPYYFRFGIKNITSLSNFSIEFITGITTSSFNITYTMIDANVLSVGNWYIVEGIINPTGGNTDPSGAIRTASGEKIATVNNAVVPSGAEKIVLGWKDSCVISRMKLSKITADTITADLASKDYVSNSISTSGYVFPEGVANAINTNTTTVDGSKITTGTINADKINTTGLIAENISAEEISGKIITGGQIVGANIVGVTIRASYLDLDGELEVLTNFYLCIGGDTTGVPALAISEGRYRTYSTADIDAVPSTSYSNLYRIPSISTVGEETKVQTLNSTGASFVSKIRSYNCANAGHNVKCVKLRPRAFVSGFNINIGLTPDQSSPYSQPYRNSSTAQMYFGGVLLGSVYFRDYYYRWMDFGDQISSGVRGGIQIYLDGGLIYSYSDSDTDGYKHVASINSPSFNTTRNVNGVIIRIACTSWYNLSFSIDNGEYELPADFNSTGESLFKVVNSIDTAYSSITAYTNSATYINNMI